MTTPKKKAASAKKAAKPAAKISWSDTIKKALENKRTGGGGPEQPKPKDSGIQKVRKNAF